MHSVSASQIFSIKTEEEFNNLAIRVFKFQASHCQVYADFIACLSINPHQVNDVKKILYLPIDFFKSHRVITDKKEPQLVFSSSGTVQSQHFVTDLTLYEDSFRKAFHIFYGDITNYAVLALLPSYSERKGSSLIYMVNNLIQTSGHPQSGYFLYNHKDLNETLSALKKQRIPTILFGVTYALLDLIEEYHINFPELIVMETGGMKGRRKEMIREELHTILCEGFGTQSIHSEYGMTELLSQAYSKGAGIFDCPPWMNIHIRDVNDPLTLLGNGKTGGVNIIDLANLNSCSFIATQDLGRVHSPGRFEILGRFDNSDIRGCNLLVL
ncbi:MAG TPA: hypothetical protein VNI52_14150 [Sphingobacteriaceae bacterium]|nr:hypothetical protein [Sphingobacteriaceae bacterium]